MTTSDNDPYLIIAADSHAGLPTEQYREYLDKKFHPAFDEFLAGRVAAVEAVADKVEAMLQDRPEKEMSTDEVGGVVMEELRRLDKVAYVRFASVYRQFRDIGEFMSELKDLLNAKE